MAEAAPTTLARSDQANQRDFGGSVNPEWDGRGSGSASYVETRTALLEVPVPVSVPRVLERSPAEDRDLPRVGMTGKHQVNAGIRCFQEEIGVVAEQHDGFVEPNTVKGFGQVGLTLAQIVHPGQPQGLVASPNPNAPVQQHSDAVLLETVLPQAQLRISVVLVISGNRENAQRCVQGRQRLRQNTTVLGASVHQIATEADQIRLTPHDPLEQTHEIQLGGEMTRVQVREEGDLEAIERWAEPHQRNLDGSQLDRPVEPAPEPASDRNAIQPRVETGQPPWKPIRRMEKSIGTLSGRSRHPRTPLQ